MGVVGASVVASVVERFPAAVVVVNVVVFGVPVLPVASVEFVGTSSSSTTTTASRSVAIHRQRQP